MKRVQQKHNHCFVACVASMLCDDEEHLTRELQNLIVNSFPDELQKNKGDEGIPISLHAIKRVLVSLGLANQVHRVTASPDLMLQYLRRGGFDLNKIILCTTDGSYHCLRIEHIYGSGLVVMDPMTGTTRDITDEEFNGLGPELLVCDAECFPGIAPL